MTPWHSLSKAISRLGKPPHDLLQKVIEANPAIYWYPGSGDDLTPLVLDAPNNPTQRRLFPQGVSAQPLILWMNDYGPSFRRFPTGQEGQRRELVVGGIQSDAEIIRIQQFDVQGHEDPWQVFQVRVTGGAARHQRPDEGEVYTVLFSPVETEKLFRRVFVTHSLRLDVVALIGQGNWGDRPQRLDFNPYIHIPLLCAQNQGAIGQVRAYLSDRNDKEFHPDNYHLSGLQARIHSGNVQMWIPNAPLA